MLHSWPPCPYWLGISGITAWKLFFNFFFLIFPPSELRWAFPGLALTLGQRVLRTCRYRRESLLRPSSTWPEPACPGSSSESSCPSSSGWKEMLDSARASLHPRRSPRRRRPMCKRCSPCCCWPVCWWKKAPCYIVEVQEDSISGWSKVTHYKASLQEVK